MAKQADGRYRAKITLGHDIDGIPIIKYVSGRTKKELEANKAELRRRHIDGRENVMRDVMFGSYAQEWYKIYKEPELREGSKGGYVAALRKRLLPAFGDRQLKAILASDIQRLLNEHANLSKTSAAYMTAILSGVFSQAAAEGIISINPTLGMMPRYASANERRALTDNEDAAALEVMRMHPEGLLLGLLYYTGMRRGEALGLKWSDINFPGREITISRDIDFKTGTEGEVKTEESERCIPLAQELIELFGNVRGVGDRYVLTAPNSKTHLCESTYKRRWARLMRAMYECDNAIDSEEQRSILTPHYFRHNFASLCHRKGVDVLLVHKWLGHSDPRTTLAIYTHLDKERDRFDAGILDSVFEKVAGKLPGG